MNDFYYTLSSGVVKRRRNNQEKNYKHERESIHPKIFIKQTQTINEGGRLYFDVQEEQKNEKNTSIYSQSRKHQGIYSRYTCSKESNELKLLNEEKIFFKECCLKNRIR